MKQKITINLELLATCKSSLKLLCTEYVNGIAEIHWGDADFVISELKNAICRAKGKKRCNY